MKNKIKKNKLNRRDFEMDGQRRRKLKPMPKGKFDWRQIQED